MISKEKKLKLHITKEKIILLKSRRKRTQEIQSQRNPSFSCPKMNTTRWFKASTVMVWNITHIKISGGIPFLLKLRLQDSFLMSCMDDTEKRSISLVNHTEFKPEKKDWESPMTSVDSHYLKTEMLITKILQGWLMRRRRRRSCRMKSATSLSIKISLFLWLTISILKNHMM